MAYIGRGAWNNAGVGGTLKFDRTTRKVVPGPWYMAAKDGQPMIGLAAVRDLRDKVGPDLNEYGVHMGAKALQMLLKLEGATLVTDGLLGPRTDAIIREYQGEQGLAPDGQVGPNTMGRLLLPHIRRLGGADWQTVFGLLKHEGGFDPGAVGAADPNDWGLAQINGIAHPEMGDARFDPMQAITFNVELLRSGLRVFNGNLRDAVASYNLGQGGTRTWIRAGRPDLWVPAGQSKSRNVKAYIDTILSAWQG